MNFTTGRYLMSYRLGKNSCTRHTAPWVSDLIQGKEFPQSRNRSHHKMQPCMLFLWYHTLQQVCSSGDLVIVAHLNKLEELGLSIRQLPASQGLQKVPDIILGSKTNPMNLNQKCTQREQNGNTARKIRSCNVCSFTGNVILSREACVENRCSQSLVTAIVLQASMGSMGGRGLLIYKE